MAKVFLARQAHHDLGFVRIGDYVRERLGMSTSQFYEIAHVSTSLTWLPLVESALDGGAISWTKARELVMVAAPDTQELWLAVAKRCTADELHRAAAEARRRAGATKLGRNGYGDDRIEFDFRDVDDVDDEDVDGEPALMVSIQCPQHVRLVWWDVVRLSCCVAGFELATWQSAEAIAAEALSASGWPDETESYVRRALRAPAADASREEGLDLPRSCDPGARTRRDHRACMDVRESTVTSEQLDARMREILAASQRTDADLGALLRHAVDLRLHRVLGYDDFNAYCRNAVGFCARKARALIAIERSRRRSGSKLMHAYRSGVLSWHRCLLLLPVVNEQTADAWIERAQSVTARRLGDEVMWARMGIDAGALAETLPPPLGARLHDDLRRLVQIRGIGSGRAPSGKGLPSAATIRFRAPGMVAHLLRAAIWQRRGSGEPVWVGLLRLLEEVRAFWLALPRHRDPVFARDGWRCAVPACSSRRNLHDHHVIFRSRGGRNGRENRVAVCAAHHYHCLHGEIVRATGRADVADTGLEWEIGRRSGREPFLRIVGHGEMYAARRGERAAQAPHVMRPTAAALNGRASAPRECAAQ